MFLDIINFTKVLCNPSYAEGCHCFAREAYKGYPILRDNRHKIYLISRCLKSTCMKGIRKMNNPFKRMT